MPVVMWLPQVLQVLWICIKKQLHVEISHFPLGFFFFFYVDWLGFEIRRPEQFTWILLAVEVQLSLEGRLAYCEAKLVQISKSSM